MLRGIPDIIGSDLLKALADTGHGDLIVIADHFYPPITKSPNAVSIQAKGCGAAQMVDAILKLVPLDVEYEKYPIQYMVPDADSGVVVESSPVWDGVKKAVVDNGYDVSCVGGPGLCNRMHQRNQALRMHHYSEGRNVKRHHANGC